MTIKQQRPHKYLIAVLICMAKLRAAGQRAHDKQQRSACTLCSVLLQVSQSTLLDVDHMVRWWAQWDAFIHEVRFRQRRSGLVK